MDAHGVTLTTWPSPVAQEIEAFGSSAELRLTREMPPALVLHPGYPQALPSGARENENAECKAEPEHAHTSEKYSDADHCLHYRSPPASLLITLRRFATVAPLGAETKRMTGIRHPRTLAAMARLEIRSLEVDDVAEAGALLADRHRRHRLAQPLLAARHESADAAASEVSAALAVEHASGTVATRGGRVVGFLLGAPKNESWGPNVWIEAAGQAAVDAEVMRDLYAVAAARWMDEGRSAHYVLVPAHDVDLVTAWFRLGFGQQHCHGIRPAPSTTPQPRLGVTVRRATRLDIPVLAQLDLVLARHQRGAPTYSAATMPTIEEAQSEWEKDIDSGEYVTFVAELDGAVVGSAIGCALEKLSSHTSLARPDHAGFLGFAAVFPHARGAGAGRALGETVLAWAATSGYDSVVTDWRVTNLLSSLAWPALGFAECFLRLHRLIGY